jgi:hypothetical protein
MGKMNPISGLTSIVRGGIRAIKGNPKKLLVGGVAGPGYLVNEGIEEEQKRAAKKAAGAIEAANANTAQAITDKLTAEESVRAQKEKARKQTIFGGSTDANLFNKSLIGASTTAAGGGARSILGA